MTLAELRDELRRLVTASHVTDEAEALAELGAFVGLHIDEILDALTEAEKASVVTTSHGSPRHL